MIGIDTNLLVRYLTRDDAAEAAIADAVIESRTSEDPGYVPAVVMAELWWVLSRSYGWAAPDIAQAMEGIAQAEEIRLEQPGCVAQALAAAGRGQGFADALICAVSLKAGARELVTLDRKAAKLAHVRLAADYLADA
ncbi:MAG: type II toxin-antitoxin system VapC family toxin [Bifidobacteriaceae bacterium]|nr:type II toxin-antitoxin system VapC family toxin [Bifidobacteriaceae bacterium]